MGGVADYSGSLLLQMALPQGTRVRLTRNGQRRHRLVSGGRRAELALGSDALREAPAWTRYVLGGVQLARARFGLPPEGLDVDVESDLPVGAGLSSSAALEVATLRALTELYGLRWANPLELPRLAQRVEHEVVGAPCGLMDQLAVHFGSPGTLLPITCRPAEVGPLLTLPTGLRFEVRPSGAEHSVGGDAYGEARAAAFMGRRLLEVMGVPTGGYLAEVPLADFERRHARLLPAAMTGADFLADYGPHLDAQTTVRPEVTYPVLAATRHPIAEHARITAFAKTLRDAVAADRALTSAELESLGAAMYASHESYTAIGLGHPATDAIVGAARAEAGAYGARVTGGGAGGSVCVLLAP